MKPAYAMGRNGLQFERRTAGADDGFGNILPATWSSIHTCKGAFKPEFGREQVEAGRLESTLRGVLTVRKSSGASSVTAADRVVFTAGPYLGQVAQVRGIVPTPDGREIEFVIETGVAT